MCLMSKRKFFRTSILVVTFLFMISGFAFATAYTEHSKTTDSTTGIITYKQWAFTNSWNSTESKTLLIPVPGKSYLSVTLVAENESGCNTKVYFKRKKKGSSTYEIIGTSLIKTNGSGRISILCWSGDVDPSVYDYYINTYAHKGLFGYSAPSATVTIKPYFNLTYDESGGQGITDIFQNGSFHVSKIMDGNIEYQAGTKVHLVANHDIGYSFVRWEGTVSGTSNTSSKFTMNADKTVKAVYEMDAPTLPPSSIVVGVGTARFSWNAVSNISERKDYEVAVTRTITEPNKGTIYLGTSFDFGNISSKNTYYAWVRAHDKADNWSDWTRTNRFSPRPQVAAISGKAFSLIKNGVLSYQIELTISNVDAATYVIEREVLGTNNWTQIASFSYSQLSAKGFKYTDTNGLAKHQKYRYRVYTKNVLNQYPSAKQISSTIIIPNKPATFTVSGPSNGLLTNNKSVTFDISPKQDAEGDSLKYRVYYRIKGNSTTTSTTDKTTSTSISFSSDGVWEWWMEVEEYDNGTGFSLTHITGSRTINLDTKLPSGTFAIKDRNSDYDFSEKGLTNTDEVELKFSNITDSNSGVHKVYIWNQTENNPNSWVNITQVLDTNNHIKSEYITKIKDGTLCVYINTSGTPDSIPWLLANNASSTKNVCMKVEDKAGNLVQVSKVVQLDTKVPSKPKEVNFSFGSTTQHDLMIFTWKADNGDGDIEKFMVYVGESDTPVKVLPDGTTTVTGITSTIIDSLGPNQKVTVKILSVDRARNESPATTYTAYTMPKLGNVTLKAEESGYSSRYGKHCLVWDLTNAGNAQSHRLEYVTPTDNHFSPARYLLPDQNGQFVHKDLTPHGTYYYRLVAINGSGLRVTGSSLTQEVPNTDPTPPVPISPKKYSTAKAVFSFEGSTDIDKTTEFEYYIRLGVGTNPTMVQLLKANNASKTATKEGLIHGQIYSWYVEVNDLHDGFARSQKAQFTVDAIQPTLHIDDMPNRPTNQRSLSFTVNDELSGVNKVSFETIDTVTRRTIQADEMDVADLTPDGNDFTGTISLTEGAYDLHIKVFDQAGNVKEEISNLNNLLVDQKSPEISNVTLQLEQTGNGYQTAKDQIPVILSVNDDFSKEHNLMMNLRYWFVENRGDEVGAGKTIPLNPNYAENKATLKLDGDNNRQYYLALVVEDQAGNPSEKNYVGPIYIDRTPPQVQIDLTGLTNHDGCYYLSDLNNLTAVATSKDEESSIQSTEYTIIAISTGDHLIDWKSSWATVKAVTLQAGESYRVKARTMNGTGLVSIVQSNEFIFDNEKPEKLVLSAPTTALVTGDIALFTIQAEDQHSPINEYHLGIGKSQGATELTSLIPGNEMGWILLNPKQSSYRLEIPAVEDGVYYATLEVVNGAGLVAKTTSTFTVDNDLEKVVIDDGGPYTPFANQLTGSWRYVGDKEISGYNYRVVDPDNQVVLDWQNTVDTETTVNGLTLLNGKKYCFEVQALYASESGQISGSSLGVIVDTTQPEVVELVTPKYATSSGLTISWEGNDPESGIAKVQVALGSDFHKTDITVGWVNLNGSTLSSDVNGKPLNLMNGQRYYLTFRAINGAGLITQRISESIRIDDTPPPVPVVEDQGAFINRKSYLKAHWTWTEEDPESGTTKYEWALLEGGQDINQVQWQSVGEKKIALNEIIQENGKTYYFAVKAINGSGLTSIGMSDGIMVDATAPHIHDVKLLDATNLGNPEIADDINYITTTTDLTLWINASEDLSGITSYLYAWGDREVVDGIERKVSPYPDNQIELSDLTLTEGEVTVFIGEAVNELGDVSATGYSTGVMLDTEAPKITYVRGVLEGDKLLFDWNGENTNSPLKEYKVALVLKKEVSLTPSEDSWVSAGLDRSIEMNGTGLADGEYVLLVKALNAAGMTSHREKGEWGVSPMITIDRSTPTIEKIECSKYVSSELVATIQASSNYGIRGYRYALGTLTNPTQFTREWIDLPEGSGLVNLKIDVNKYPSGTEMYLRVQAINNSGLWSEIAESEKIVIDRTPPEVPEITCGAYTTSKNQIVGITLIPKDDPESGVVYYQLGIVTEPGGEWLATTDTQEIENFDERLTGLNLTEATIYYLAIKTQNEAGIWSSIGYSTPILVDTQGPVLTFEQESKEIVLNEPPVDVHYTLAEESSVELTLIAPDGSRKEFSQSGQLGSNRFSFEESKPGTYTLIAKAIDFAGNSGAEKEQRIRVNTPPIVELPEELCTTPGEPLQPGESVTFTAYRVDDPDGTPDKYEWNPGDEQPIVTGASPTYSYAEPGDYTVRLTVTDNEGGSSSDTVIVKVRNSSKGELHVDEIWSGEHHLYGDLVVPVGKKLTILPGTTVIIDRKLGQTDYDYSLNIKGTLEIQGATENVTFRSFAGTPGSWKGICVEGKAVIEGATIQHAIRGITIVDNVEATISNSIFKDNIVGMHLYGVQPTIRNIYFESNVWYGIKEDEGGRPSVIDCIFKDNGIDYYHEYLTEINIDQLNNIEGNYGNRKE